MWRSVVISVILTLIIFLSLSCLTTDRRVAQNTNQGHQQANDDVKNGEHLIEFNFYEFVEEQLTTDIKNISQKIELPPLPKNARPDEFEFRIWTNLGSFGDAKLLIIRSGKDENHAYFFGVNRALNPIKFRKEHLTSPKSGWNRMLFEVRSQLTNPKGLIRDPQFSLARDESVILLEVLEKEEYRRVFYGQNTIFQDGKRLIKVCDYLTSEFGVDMNC